MANARQSWALLAAVFALAAIDCRYLEAAQPGAIHRVPPPGHIGVGPGYAPADTQYLPAAEPFVVEPPSYPPERLVSYPKTGSSLWYFLVDGMALKRDASGDRGFAANGPAGNVILATQDLEFDFQSGLRTLVGRRLGDWYGFEVSYFGLFDWAESAAVRDSTPNAGGGLGNLFSPFSNFGTNPAGGTVGLDFNKFASISYVTDLDNIEWNLRRTLVMPSDALQVSLLVGGRYMKIDERLNYFTSSDIPLGLGATNFVGTATKNDMVGVQIGALFEFHVEPSWWIDTEIKGAVFDNDVSQATNYVNRVDGIQSTFPSARSENRSAWALDLSLTLSGQINSWLTVRVGYQALWIDGLALASENFQRDVGLLTLGPPQLNHSGKVVYHGPHIGLSGAW